MPARHQSGLVDLELINAFVAVAGALSFAMAARQLETDPSVVSRRVRRLEARLGVRLFSRTTRRVALTEVGERYLLRVADLLEQLDAAGREAAELADTAQGLLRVSASRSYGRLVIAPMLADFLRSYPRIRVDLQLADRLVDLVADGFDVAIRSGPLRDSSLVVRRLVTYRDILLASPGYLRRHGRPRSPADLAGHACIGFTGRADWPEWRLQDGRQTVVLRPACPLIVDSSQVLITAAGDGAGIVLVPEWVASEAVAAGRLVRILTRWQGSDDTTIHALMPPGRMIPAKSRVFVEALASTLHPQRRAPPRQRP